jgi:general secretion pathway protein D
VTANSPENLAAVEEVLKQLDTPSQAGETTLRIGLRFAKASTVANNINILFARNGAPPLRQVNQPAQQNQPNPQQGQQQQNNSYQGNFALEHEIKEDGYYPWLGGQQDNPRGADGRSAIRPVSDLVGRVRVVPDDRSNSLLVSANAHFFAQLLKLIEELDVPTAQVLIEAKIIEVSTDFLEKLGVRWSPDGSKTFTADDYDNSVLLRTKGEYIKQFGGALAPFGGVGGVAASLANSMHSGVIDNTLSMDFLIQFLRRTTDATVLAAPQVNIADNEVGKLFVGQQVPVPDNNQVSQLGLSTTTVRYRDVGVILEVTPHINNAGDVALKIRTESSAVVPGELILNGAVFDTRSFKTDLTAKNGQTLVLGGIIQRNVSDSLRRTPGLGRIPGLGWAFKKKDKLSREVELLVFLRPKIVRSPEEARELLQEMDRKAPLIKKWKDANEPNDDDKTVPDKKTDESKLTIKP